MPIASATVGDQFMRLRGFIRDAGSSDGLFPLALRPTARPWPSSPTSAAGRGARPTLIRSCSAPHGPSRRMRPPPRPPLRRRKGPSAGPRPPRPPRSPLRGRMQGWGKGGRAMQRESPVPATVLASSERFPLVPGALRDDLGHQGLDGWRDDQRRWHWRWRGTHLTSRAGLANLGAAVSDARVRALWAMLRPGGSGPRSSCVGGRSAWPCPACPGWCRGQCSPPPLPPLRAEHAAGPAWPWVREAMSGSAGEQRDPCDGGATVGVAAPNWPGAWSCRRATLPRQRAAAWAGWGLRNARVPGAGRAGCAPPLRSPVSEPRLSGCAADHRAPSSG